MCLSVVGWFGVGASLQEFYVTVMLSLQASSASASFKTLSYPTLAFEFQYPVATSSGASLPVVISRKPERYSSAAPLTADARQRIVTELVDFPDGITISVSVSKA